MMVLLSGAAMQTMQVMTTQDAPRGLWLLAHSCDDG